MSSSTQILKERGLERAYYGYLSTSNNVTFVSYSLNTFHSHLFSELFLKSVYSFSITHFRLLHILQNVLLDWPFLTGNVSPHQLPTFDLLTLAVGFSYNDQCKHNT